MAKPQITAEPGIPQIIMTCEFDAPRDLVYRAYTEPELLQQWLGPRDLTITVKENDVRDGRKWRFVHTDAGGHEHGLHRVFHGDPSPEGVGRTLEYGGAPRHRSMATLTLTGPGGSGMGGVVTPAGARGPRTTAPSTGSPAGTPSPTGRRESPAVSLGRSRRAGTSPTSSGCGTRRNRWPS